MADNQRSYAASGLRDFFDHQIQHIEKLFDGFAGLFAKAEPLSAEDRVLIENFVDVANNKMRVIDGYASKLREYVKGIYAHVHQIADEIPLPIELSEQSLKELPLINALFVNNKDIDDLCHGQLEATRYLRSHRPSEVPKVYAVLTANKSERSALGVGMLGNILVRDVQQQIVNFSSHKLYAFSASADELDQELKKYLFDNVVGLIKQDLNYRICEEIKSPNANSYEAKIHSLANPNVYLQSVIEYLAAPSLLLDLEKTHFRLNKLGVKLLEAQQEYVNEFDIHEVIWGKQQRNLILPIFYPRTEM